ncbi:MAG: hypothetical protein GPOALKHO_000279 [Sodalis sp.]|nr:MAG: hypothetical protein GPOALKHO_000279 [Sodalis sp.]
MRELDRDFGALSEEVYRIINIMEMHHVMQMSWSNLKDRHDINERRLTFSVLMPLRMPAVLTIVRFMVFTEERYTNFDSGTRGFNA